MSKLLESLIARGRRVRRPREQREVAFGLADLSTHTEVHTRLVQKGGIKSLIKLLEKSADQEAQRFAALALGNVASTAENRIPMVDEGSLRPLITYIRNEDGDVIGRQYSALALGNLASEPENHEEIVKLDGIDSLITLLKAEDVHSGRYAAFALSNLASNPSHRYQIVEEGAIAPLVALACCDDQNAQRQALAALRGLAVSIDNRHKIVREGVLDPLVLMARTEDIEIKREVAAAFCSLSSVQDNKVEIADRALSTIITLSLSGDDEVEKQAISTVANLVEMVELHDKLLGAFGFMFLDLCCCYVFLREKIWQWLTCFYFSSFLCLLSSYFLFFTSCFLLLSFFFRGGWSCTTDRSCNGRRSQYQGRGVSCTSKSCRKS